MENCEKIRITNGISIDKYILLVVDNIDNTNPFVITDVVEPSKLDQDQVYDLKIRLGNIEQPYKNKTNYQILDLISNLDTLNYQLFISVVKEDKV